MQITLTKLEYDNIKRAIQFSMDALLSGGDEEKRRFGNPVYDWQLVNDAISQLEEVQQEIF